MFNVEAMTEKLSHSLANCVDTDFRFNPRILSFLEMDPLKLEKSISEGSIFKMDDQLSPRSTASKKSSDTFTGKIEYRIHKIETGDTLESISKKYNILVANIKLLNKIVGRHIAGRKTLKIPYENIDAKSFKEEKEKLRKQKNKEKEKQFLIALKSRTGIQNQDQLLEYYRKSNGLYYTAANLFSTQEVNRCHEEFESRRSSLRDKASLSKARNVILAPNGPEIDPLILAVKNTPPKKKRTNIRSTRLNNCCPAKPSNNVEHKFVV